MLNSIRMYLSKYFLSPKLEQGCDVKFSWKGDLLLRFRTLSCFFQDLGPCHCCSVTFCADVSWIGMRLPEERTKWQFMCVFSSADYWPG